MTSSGPDPLLIDLAAGSEQAYSLLYERFGVRLYRFALGMLGRREDAEDAVQEVFAALVRSQKKLAGVNDLTAYLFAALRNAVARCAERRKRDLANLEAATEAARILGDGSENSENPDAERLQQALAALPAEQREVVSLKIAGELTFAQIGEVLNVSQNTAASRYRYALEKLRSMMLPSPVGRGAESEGP
jgi:RNA polymerase sigma-70 factor (ECF subfamily)